MSKEFRDVEDLLEEDLNQEEFLLLEEEVEEINFPHWRIAKEEIQPILKVIKNISQKTVDKISRSILLRKGTGNNLYFFITNRDIYYSGSLELKNDQKVYEGEVILGIAQLERVVKFSTDLIIFYDADKDMFFASLMRGIQPLDSYKFESKIFQLSENPSKEGLKLDSLELRVQLELLEDLMTLAPVAEDKKMLIEGKYAYGNFTSVLTRVDVSLPTMVVRISDARDLVTILNIVTGDVEIKIDKNRIYFLGPKFRYSSLRAVMEIGKDVVSRFELEKESLILDSNHLWNLFSYLTLSFSDSAVAFIKYKDDPEMKPGTYLVCRDRMGKVSNFFLSPEERENEFGMSIELSRNVFRILKRFPTIELIKDQPGSVMYKADSLVLIQGVREK